MYTSFEVAYAGAGKREQPPAKEPCARQYYVSQGKLGVLHSALDNCDEAFTSLERAYAAHDLQLKYLRVDPAFNPLVSDARFVSLLRRMKLLEAGTQAFRLQ